MIATRDWLAVQDQTILDVLRSNPEAHLLTAQVAARTVWGALTVRRRLDILWTKGKVEKHVTGHRRGWSIREERP